MGGSGTNGFESSVNSEGIETNHYIVIRDSVFESSVNSEGIETLDNSMPTTLRLRAV